MKNRENQWLKNRGYLHITNQLNIKSDRNKIISLIKNEHFISSYAFFPLIHDIIKERRYKQHPDKIQGVKCHSYKTPSGVKRNIKKRPLHYATHMDACIFSYYSELLLQRYESYLRTRPLLSESVTAYRRIPKQEGQKNKSTINFAYETFDEIKRRCLRDDCVVLKFDIKSFFNEIDHALLKKQWAEILEKDRLPDDHYNVFKGVTQFSYIMKDDLRVNTRLNGRRLGFDEKKIAELKRKKIYSFFESPKEFRESIKGGKIKIHKTPFTKEGVACGFPQGLPISSTLANLYLLKFDEAIIENVVNALNGFYRRYSDDIIILITRENLNKVESFVINEIKKSRVEISIEKTERFIFRKEPVGSDNNVKAIKLNNDGSEDIGIPLTYLGFEFHGNKTLIKSANLAKFYRRLIRAVKIKAKRAYEAQRKNPTLPLTIYKNQLLRLYVRYPLSAGSLKIKTKCWKQNSFGNYYLDSEFKPSKYSSNYLSYVNRASQEMDEPSLLNQIKSHRRVLYSALRKHLLKKQKK